MTDQPTTCQFARIRRCESANPSQPDAWAQAIVKCGAELQGLEHFAGICTECARGRSDVNDRPMLRIASVEADDGEKFALLAREHIDCSDDDMDEIEHHPSFPIALAAMVASTAQYWRQVEEIADFWRKAKGAKA